MSLISLNVKQLAISLFSFLIEIVILVDQA